MLDTAKVRKLRIKSGMTLDEAAERAHFVNRQQWYLIESGQRANITLETLFKIASALGVEASELLKRPAKGSR
jgi:transcriptional regulator with XRE-family HTH domain